MLSQTTVEAHWKNEQISQATQANSANALNSQTLNWPTVTNHNLPHPSIKQSVIHVFLFDKVKLLVFDRIPSEQQKTKWTKTKRAGDNNSKREQHIDKLKTQLAQIIQNVILSNNRQKTGKCEAMPEA